jgi:hypothetical protein
VSRSPVDVLGWVPVDLGWDGQDVSSGLRRIAWMDCGGVTFTEPFFLQTVARLRSPSEGRKVITTTLEAIQSRFGESFDFNPAGLIFHVSRCGSTALANCLKHCESAQVISEYWPLTQYHWRYRLSRLSQEHEAPNLLDMLTIKAGAWSLATCRYGIAQDLVLKLTSSSLLSLDAIKALWPKVPCVLIVRHPLEVLMASLRGGGWMDLRGDALRSACLLGDSSGEVLDAFDMSNEEYGACVVGNYLDVALKHLSAFDMVVDYNEISGEKIQAVATLFNLRPAASAAFENELTLDAKRRDGSRYIRDATSEQIIGSAKARIAVERHATPRYEALMKELKVSLRG